MKKFLFTLIFLVIALPIKAAPYKIVALVNGEIISSEDFQNRINLFLMNTGIPFNQQTQGMILQKVLNNTVDEKLKIQEATKEGISITEEELNNQIKQYEKNYQIPSGQLNSILKKANVDKQVFAEQIKADFLWLRLIRKKHYSEGITTQKEIDIALEEAKKDLNTPKYLVSEIFIKKENAKNIAQLVANLRADNRFELYAMQFSDSPSAANGGNLGWVNTGKLPSVLEAKLKKMHVGQISDPIWLGDGYYILKLQQTFNPQKDKAQTPAQNTIKTLLDNQKMETLSKKLLQDLRQKAVIEIRN